MCETAEAIFKQGLLDIPLAGNSPEEVNSTSGTNRNNPTECVLSVNSALYNHHFSVFVQSFYLRITHIVK